ncbi:Uncharacterized protein conserved in bacteria [Serratia grimesii]|uniref:DUF1643 domain-containing protein n=1 Tax=Serratia grimesii TaxID=82995 RepID=UPI0021C4D5B0|nr:DUF1643 domain-containing protein [Serratia grimesii]CAI2789886.1 Uncharacterized protein conserved in bacteria [Serratia grimesii]
MEMLKSAVFSDCGQYRYAIARIWDETKPYALFIGLNPSYADATQDDPTLGLHILADREHSFWRNVNAVSGFA